MARKKATEAQEDIAKVKIVVEIELDGDVWCAHGPEFTNLQDCPASFGKTPAKAAYKYLTEVKTLTEVKP